MSNIPPPGYVKESMTETVVFKFLDQIKPTTASIKHVVPLLQRKFTLPFTLANNLLNKYLKQTT